MALPDPTQSTSGSVWRRLLWPTVGKLLFRCSMHNAYRWRRMLLRLFGADVAQGVWTRPSTVIDQPWNLTLEHRSVLGDGVVVYASAPVTIGERAVISQFTIISTWRVEPRADGYVVEQSPVTVEADCWVAADSHLDPGVRVGAGSVVGARSRVTGDLPAWQICAGHPARALKGRKMRSES